MVSTATAVLLDKIESAFNSESDPGRYSGWGKEEVRQVAEPSMREANELNIRNMSVQSALRAAELYGMCAAIAVDTELHDLEFDARSRFAQLLAWVVGPNRDECRDRASGLFFELGELCLKRGDKSLAAISLTNGALCLLEMSNPTTPQILRAKEICQRTLKMRRKGSVDYAYSEMNLALAERKSMGPLPYSEKVLASENVLRAFDRAFRLLKKHNEVPGPFRAIYHQNVIELLIYWVGYEDERSRAEMYADCVPVGVDPESNWGIPRRDFAALLVSNPAVFGYLETPEWVPDSYSVLSDALAKVKPLWSRLSAAEKFLESSGKANNDLRVAVFKLKSCLTPVIDPPAPPLDALERIWDEGNYETYFNLAASIVQWGHSAATVPEAEYITILRRILPCVLRFRGSWSTRDVERFLIRNPHTFRFAACELASRECWKDAFMLLEASRGLISSKTLNEDPSRFDAVEDGISWVHVTHSPKSAYVVVRQGGRYFGAKFSELSGKSLTAEFMNVARGGILSAVDRRRKQAVESATRIETNLRPMVEWISLNTGERIVIMPGGYFQSFPVSACGKLGEEALAGRKKVTTAPSRAVAYRNSAAVRRSSRARSGSIQIASDVPGQNSLKWARHEPEVFNRLMATCSWSFVKEDATGASVIASFREADIVHFTGHSKSEMFPLDSHLLTYGQPLMVREILDCETSSSLAVFGSCESALARNEDEMLSLQTAAYYAGASAAIGTTWAIMDPAGFAFTAIFYETLHFKGAFARERIEFDSVIEAHAVALAWMRDSNIAELNSLFVKYGAPEVSADGRLPAFQFYDWAAFVLVGVEL